MEKKKFIILFSIFIFLIISYLTYCRLIHRKGQFLTIEKAVGNYPFLPCPSSDDYSICYIERENKSVIPVTEREWLDCGKEVEVKIKINFTDQNYKLCLNRDKLIGGNSEAPGAYNYDNGSKVFSCDAPVPLVGELYEWGTIPEREGNFKFAEFYAFPKELNLKEEELVKNLNLGKKILTIEREIKCQQNMEK